MKFTENLLYKSLFFIILLLYILLYAPFGINDTDGGFITAYAWRVLNGELIYQDFIYVRPPFSVYLRALEMYLLPDHLEIIGERISFYVKIAIYSYLGASILLKGHQKWLLAILGFIVSVHNYPAAAWHTVDGIFFAVIGFWILFKQKYFLFFAALCIFFSAMSKQSFYPVIPLFLVTAFLLKGFWKGLSTLISLAFIGFLFLRLLQSYEIVDAFLSMVNGATTIGQALQRGVYDYFLFNHPVWLLTLLLIPFFFFKKWGIDKRWFLGFFVLSIIGTFGYAIYDNQSFSVPMEQTRLLFLIALGFGLYDFIRGLIEKRKDFWKKTKRGYLKFAALLGISWMSAISWGYNFPVLFSTPFIFVFFLMLRRTEEPLKPGWRIGLQLSLIVILLGVFRFAYEFVYRQGPHSEMSFHMGDVFPKLTYIYSNEKTFKKHQELKAMRIKYGRNFKTLPAFPLSNYLTDTQSPLQIDWVFDSETNKQNEAIYQRIKTGLSYYFIEKDKLQTIENDPKYQVSKYVLEKLEEVEETEFFKVFR